MNVYLWGTKAKDHKDWSKDEISKRKPAKTGQVNRSIEKWKHNNNKKMWTGN